jgi:outer membrane protein
MKCVKTWLAGGLLILALAPATASAIGIEAALGVWNQNPVGDISFKAGSANDNLNIKDNLRYSDETKITGRVKIEMPLFIPNVYLMATPTEFNGTGIKNTTLPTFQFGNVAFDANVPFTSKLKLDHYDIGLFYGVPMLKTATAGVLNVEVGLNARIIDFKAEVTGTANGQTTTESKALTIPVPMLYAGVQVTPVKWFAAEGEIRGIAYGGNHYFDLIGRAKFKPYGPFFAAVGYRYDKVKIDVDDVKADATFSGPFGELGVEF